MTSKFAVIVVLIVSGLLNQNIFAQFETKTVFSSMYDDNVNNNSLKLQSTVSILNLNSGYKWETESTGLRCFYDGTYSYFAAIPNRSFHFQSANIEFTRLSGEDNENILNLGGHLGMGTNREEYAVFNHNEYSSYINYKFFPTERVINKFGYQFKSMQFTSLSDLSYIEHALFAHSAFALTDATTLILQTDLGTKYYSSASTSDYLSAENNMSSLLPDVAQLSGLLKIGQRITETTGLSLLSKHQWNVRKESRYLSSDYGLISDDELFDDHYGYEGSQTSVTLSHLFSETMVAKLTLGIQNKLYSTLQAYDIVGNVIANQRADSKSYLNLQFQKNFESLGFTLKTATDIIYNKSNDVFYNYHNSAFTLEIEVPF